MQYYFVQQMLLILQADEWNYLSDAIYQRSLNPPVLALILCWKIYDCAPHLDKPDLYIQMLLDILLDVPLNPIVLLLRNIYL